MAACGPIGVLGLKSEFEPKVLRKSATHKIKEVELAWLHFAGGAVDYFDDQLPDGG